MSHSLFQQPENLTKDRLKAELKKHGVTFDPNENKDYYVRLYRSKVSRSTGRRQRSELSSDEELVRRSPRFGTKKQPSKTASQSSYMAGVSQLSDEDLAEELRRYGENPGPIMDTTRGVYQRQLAKLMAERTKESSKARDEATDYATDQMGEWSSHSSEGETDLEEQEEGEGEVEEEEAGVTGDPSPIRLRSHSATAKVWHDGTTTLQLVVEEPVTSQQMAYVSYSTPTRHVESSYLLKKPAVKSSKRDTGADQSSRAKVRGQKPRPHTDKSTEATPVAPAAESSVWSSILSFALLVVMFVVTFLAYDHWTSENSLLTRATAYLNEAGILSSRQED